MIERKVRLHILDKPIYIGISDASINLLFVGIKSTAVFTKDVEHVIHPTKDFRG
jgi:hypothetical protein